MESCVVELEGLHRQLCAESTSTPRQGHRCVSMHRSELVCGWNSPNQVAPPPPAAGGAGVPAGGGFHCHSSQEPPALIRRGQGKVVGGVG